MDLVDLEPGRAVGLEVARTWWFTGLPAAGKSTLAQALEQALRGRGEPVCVIDGDVLRQGLCRDLGFSTADRAENVRRAAELAALVNASGIHALVALISPFAAGRALARQCVGTDRFLEVHVSTPLEVCRSRDPKGLYARALTEPSLGLTGLQAPYEAPESPDLVLNAAEVAVEEAVCRLMALKTIMKGKDV